MSCSGYQRGKGNRDLLFPSPGASAVVLTDKSKEKLCCQVQQGQTEERAPGDPERRGEERSGKQPVVRGRETHTSSMCVCQGVLNKGVKSERSQDKQTSPVQTW